MQLSEIKQKFKDIYEDVYYYLTLPYDYFKKVRCWFRNCFNKHHLKFVWKAITAYPFDFGYIYEIEYYQLKEMLAYMQQEKFTTHETYAEIIKWIRIEISLLEIITNRRDTFHYNGELTFEPVEGKDGYSKVNTDNLEYVCDVNVNTRNAKRFFKDNEYLKYVLEHPHEIYEQKAKYLYHKIKYNFIEYWWD